MDDCLKQQFPSLLIGYIKFPLKLTLWVFCNIQLPPVMVTLVVCIIPLGLQGLQKIYNTILRHRWVFVWPSERHLWCASIFTFFRPVACQLKNYSIYQRLKIKQIWPMTNVLCPTIIYAILEDKSQLSLSFWKQNGVWEYIVFD